MVGIDLANQPLDVNGEAKLLDDVAELVGRDVARLVRTPTQRDERIDCKREEQRRVRALRASDGWRGTGAAACGAVGCIPSIRR